MLAGRYFINPRFATVEIMEMTKVPIANVGVVIAYVGGEGRGRDGRRLQARQPRDKGEKGVWVEPLDPGKYPINTYTHKVEIVPDRQRGAELGHRQDRGAQARQEPVDHHGALVRRLHVQPRRQPDHPHSAHRRAQGHRALRQHGEPGHAGARADDRQLLPQRRAGLGRDRLPEERARAPGRGARTDLRGARRSTTSARSTR